MPITGGKSKSRMKRKPLRDVSNATAFKRPVTTHSVMKKQESVTTSGDPLDRLLLVHSDLSALIHQVNLTSYVTEKEGFFVRIKWVRCCYGWC
ncbi:hypothetical protein HanOQP8_Chr09g0346301 [Helianthus annuus]|nr:hypothetical protein HanLR1_Chr09g0342211 [Helianthus annuus]KAJ0713477.1 hypothetical protein HanOQP8_Chr09g0346301 [Helianthus annuus]